ncbi:MAG: chemotaxis protein CheW [Sphingomonadaceae bacterium]|nr:chemotaxis protein CheW [Sphingomonadaceae bacterium]
MGALYLVVEAGGERIALPAMTVDSVVEGVAVVRVPLAARHVAGLAALRSRVLTMIDVAAATGVEGLRESDKQSTVIIPIDGQLYGLLVEAVDDVVEVEGDIEPLRGGVAAGWAAASLGMIEIEGRATLVVDPGALVAGPIARAA